MKKSSVWFLFLSALLCLSMLLSACSPNDADGEKLGETTAATTQEPVPVDVPVDYASILAKWGAQLAPLADEAPAEASMMFWYDKTDRNQTVTVSQEGGFYVVTRTRPNAAQDRTYQVYSMESGEKIFEKSVRRYDEDTNISTALLFDAVDPASGFLEIEERKNLASVYSYYDKDGNALATDLKTPDYSIDVQGSFTYVTIADKVYACKDGEICATFQKGSEIVIPEYDFAYGDYLYKVEPEYNGVIARGQVSRIAVMDKSYNLLVDYHVDPSYHWVDYYVLNNGDLFFQYDYLMENGDTDPDYEMSALGVECRLRQEIVSAKTGAVTGLDPTFRVAELYTKQNVEELGLELKGEGQIAAIERITDGKINTKCEFVVLDNALTVGETLPSIVQNQQAVEKGLDANTYLISALHYDGSALYYSVNIAQNTVSLYVNGDVADEANNPVYRPVKGGVLSMDVLYNTALEEIYDLRYVESYTTYDEFLLLHDGEETTLCYIKDGKACTQAVTGYVLSQGKLIPATGKGTVRTIYNAEGRELISGTGLQTVSLGDRVIVRRETTTYSEYYILK